MRDSRPGILPERLRTHYRHLRGRSHRDGCRHEKRQPHRGALPCTADGVSPASAAAGSIRGRATATWASSAGSEDHVGDRAAGALRKYSVLLAALKRGAVADRESRSASHRGERVAGSGSRPRFQIQEVSLPESVHSAPAGRGISLRLRADAGMNALAPPLRSQARAAIALMCLRCCCLAAGGRQTNIFDVKPGTGGAQRDLLDLRWDTVKHQHKASALAVADVEL